jgi:hypothetical protein
VIRSGVRQVQRAYRCIAELWSGAVLVAGLPGRRRLKGLGGLCVTPHPVETKDPSGCSNRSVRVPSVNSNVDQPNENVRCARGIVRDAMVRRAHTI